MAIDPFVSFQDEFIHGDNSFMWNPFSPIELPPADFGPGFSDLIMVLEPPSEVEAPTTASRSAFVPFNRSGNAGFTGGGGRSMHTRVIEMLRRIPRPEESARGVEMSRGFKHMMRERQRREKLSQSYADLYSIVATRSKSDKNSIVRSATAYVRELKGVKDALQKHNEELKKQILGSNGTEEVSKIKIRIANPTSSIDSMIGALKCLKSMDVKARAIRSDLSNCEFSAIMNIDTKIAADEVERAVEVALTEVEKKLHFMHLPGINIQT